jgi:hypothetical protein
VLHLLSHSCKFHVSLLLNFTVFTYKLLWITYTYTRYDPDYEIQTQTRTSEDTDTSTPIIIWENDII